MILYTLEKQEKQTARIRKRPHFSYLNEEELIKTEIELKQKLGNLLSNLNKMSEEDL
ncbi:MAG: hypothetical protein AAF228_13180 [Pseudomonadota bacterium]